MAFFDIPDQRFPDTETGRRTSFWFGRLCDMVVSLFDWKGLPDSVNRDYMEHVLMTEGSIVWVNDSEGNLRALRGARFGFDPYGFPTNATIANPVLGTLTAEIGKNAVWMRNNRYAKPTIPVIRAFAIQLALIDVDFKVNLDNLKTTVLFKVTNDGQARKLKEIYKKVIDGEPAIINASNDDWFNDDDITVFSQDVRYLCDKLLADRRSVLNDFLTQFGVNNIAVEKKERLVTGEVSGNDQELAIMASYWLDTRIEAVEKINAMFGTAIDVSLKSETEVEQMDERLNESPTDEEGKDEQAS